MQERCKAEGGSRTGLRTSHAQPFTKSFPPQATRFFEPFHYFPACALCFALPQPPVPVSVLNEFSPFGCALRLALPLMQLLFTCPQSARGVCGRLPRHVQRVADVGEVLEEFARGECEVREGDYGVCGAVREGLEGLFDEWEELFDCV